MGSGPANDYFHSSTILDFQTSVMLRRHVTDTFETYSLRIATYCSAISMKLLEGTTAHPSNATFPVRANTSKE